MADKQLNLRYIKKIKVHGIYIYFNHLLEVLINNVCSLETNVNKFRRMIFSRIWDQQMQNINPEIGRVNGPTHKRACCLRIEACTDLTSLLSITLPFE